MSKQNAKRDGRRRRASQASVGKKARRSARQGSRGAIRSSERSKPRCRLLEADRQGRKWKRKDYQGACRWRTCAACSKDERNQVLRSVRRVVWRWFGLRCVGATVMVDPVLVADLNDHTVQRWVDTLSELHDWCIIERTILGHVVKWEFAQGRGPAPGPVLPHLHLCLLVTDDFTPADLARILPEGLRLDDCNLDVDVGWLEYVLKPYGPEDDREARWNPGTRLPLKRVLRGWQLRQWATTGKSALPLMRRGGLFDGRTENPALEVAAAYHGTMMQMIHAKPSKRAERRWGRWADRVCIRPGVPCSPLLQERLRAQRAQLWADHALERGGETPWN
jgi:hypothetical protein